jgi:hypothetical protein
MFLPIRGFHDLGQGRPFGPRNQFQNLCALALGAWRAGVLGLGGLGFLAGLGLLLRRGLGFALGGFLALGRALLRAGTFFEEAFCGATCAPCSAIVAPFSVIVASAFVMVGESFLRLWRMTIHHSGWLEMQGKTGHLGEKSGRGERLAMAMSRQAICAFSRPAWGP